MATKSKRAKHIVKLVSTAKNNSGKQTGYFVIRTRNPKKLTDKLSFRKYDPIARQHVLFQEKKNS